MMDSMPDEYQGDPEKGSKHTREKPGIYGKRGVGKGVRGSR